MSHEELVRVVKDIIARLDTQDREINGLKLINESKEIFRKELNNMPTFINMFAPDCMTEDEHDITLSPTLKGAE